jgi:hypothetical protein
MELFQVDTITKYHYSAMPKDTAKATKASKPKSDKPKRSPSAYIIFAADMRPKIRASNPEATFGELGKLLGAKWGALSEAEKAVRLTF